MINAKYTISVKVGEYVFSKTFMHEIPAIACFDSIVGRTDLEVDNGFLKVPVENVTVSEASIAVEGVPLRLGDPNQVSF